MIPVNAERNEPVLPNHGIPLLFNRTLCCFEGSEEHKPKTSRLLCLAIRHNEGFADTGAKLAEVITEHLLRQGGELWAGMHHDSDINVSMRGQDTRANRFSA